jgi:hypothetical protein
MGSRLEVDQQLELRGLLDRKIAGLCPLEDSVDPGGARGSEHANAEHAEECSPVH